jgi:hypothetical protein
VDAVSRSQPVDPVGRNRPKPPDARIASPAARPVDPIGSVDPAGSADPAGPIATQLLVGAGIVLVQAVALLGAALVLIVKTLTGHPDSVGRALLGAAMALLGAVVLVACARGLQRHRPASRTPIVVIELLALPVGYSLGFQAGLIGYGGPMLVSALAVLYLVFTPPARAALDRRRDLET